MSDLLRALKEDAQRMEDICIRLGRREDIWQDRVIYWMGVALAHIITWILRQAPRERGQNGL